MRRRRLSTSPCCSLFPGTYIYTPTYVGGIVRPIDDTASFSPPQERQTLYIKLCHRSAEQFHQQRLVYRSTFPKVVSWPGSATASGEPAEEKSATVEPVEVEKADEGPEGVEKSATVEPPDVEEPATEEPADVEKPATEEPGVEMMLNSPTESADSGGDLIGQQMDARVLNGVQISSHRDSCFQPLHPAYCGPRLGGGAKPIRCSCGCISCPRMRA
jgi:hypothetical protein